MKTGGKAWGKVGVLMGGNSSEREISLTSGRAVLASLQNSGIETVALDLSGQWVMQLQDADIDMAFIALHGTWGEDGCVQGLLEILKVPYTGSSVLASALCMDKKMTKSLLQQASLSVPVDIPIQEHGPIRYPVFIKPVAEGSSVGLHYVKSASAWKLLALPSVVHWMAEMPVVGVEIAVSVVQGEALMPVEVCPVSGVYDFISKYTQGATQYFCPARLPPETLRLCMQQAEQAVKVLGCDGAPRVDMIVGDGGVPTILEVNTIPGMTATSLLPKAAAAAGIDFDELCLKILSMACLYHVGK
ncbi:MAG: D-alanine--D-alanine ligase [Zetaproteobacteria bacterium]|nr:D-alanine--D-alanine ligase [Zetaproteobacteria bacterium]